MNYIIVSTLLCLTLLDTPATLASSRRSFINRINNVSSTWVAGENFPDSIPTEHLHYLNGFLGIDPDPNFIIAENTHVIPRNQIPADFDAREAWPECRDIIENIMDQGACGSCWAFASTEVMSDRLCISSKATKKFVFSPEDLLECCTSCRNQCEGGYINSAFKYWINNGVVSGGDYNSGLGCKPYSKEAHINSRIPTCVKNCQAGYKTSYKDDKKFGVSVYGVPAIVEQIQMEIMLNGPVIAGYEVYEDFYLYKKGVYQYVTGPKVGNHAVKIVGWGTENDTPYWLVANSWGRDWGDLGGFFKILRGKNHCDIENYITAGKSSASSVYICYFLLMLATVINSTFFLSR
jgi:cathepsin B